MTSTPHRNQKKAAASERNQLSPFYPPHYWKAYVVTSVPFFLIDLIRSGFLPAADDSKAWYDRVIRAGGGLILFLTLVFGLLFKLFGR